jgi:hypothetical protein
MGSGMQAPPHEGQPHPLTATLTAGVVPAATPGANSTGNGAPTSTQVGTNADLPVATRAGIDQGSPTAAQSLSNTLGAGLPPKGFDFGAGLTFFDPPPGSSNGSTALSIFGGYAPFIDEKPAGTAQGIFTATQGANGQVTTSLSPSASGSTSFTPGTSINYADTPEGMQLVNALSEAGIQQQLQQFDPLSSLPSTQQIFNGSLLNQQLATNQALNPISSIFDPAATPTGTPIPGTFGLGQLVDGQPVFASSNAADNGLPTQFLAGTPLNTVTMNTISNDPFLNAFQDNASSGATVLTPASMLNLVNGGGDAGTVSDTSSGTRSAALGDDTAVTDSGGLQDGVKFASDDFAGDIAGLVQTNPAFAAAFNVTPPAGTNPTGSGAANTSVASAAGQSGSGADNAAGNGGTNSGAAGSTVTGTDGTNSGASGDATGASGTGAAGASTTGTSGTGASGDGGMVPRDPSAPPVAPDSDGYGSPTS